MKTGITLDRHVGELQSFDSNIDNGGKKQLQDQLREVIKAINVEKEKLKNFINIKIPLPGKDLKSGKFYLKYSQLDFSVWPDSSPRMKALRKEQRLIRDKIRSST